MAPACASVPDKVFLSSEKTLACICHGLVIGNWLNR
jgi:hypothetical protein